MGVVHSGSPSLHTAIKDSSDESGAALGEGPSSGSPSPQGCNMVTLSVPITTTSALESTPTLLTIPTVTVWTAVPQPGMELLYDQQQAYQEEERAQIHAQ
jgi:hypothetical protein